MQSPDFQFKILALAPFTVPGAIPSTQDPLAVDRHTLDECMADMQIELYLPLEGNLCRSGGVTFRFDTLKSLHPDGMVNTNAYLAQLLQAKAFIEESRKAGHPSGEIATGLGQWPDLPPISIKADTPKQPHRRQDSAVDNILDMVALPDAQTTAPAVYKDETDQIQAIAQRALAALFDAPDFRRMEAAWRGLRLLLQHGIPEGTVKVEVAPVHPETLESVMETLTPHLLDNPPGLILLDLALDNSPLSLERMAQVAQWAATLMVPVVAWTPAGFFQIDEWSQLDGLSFIPNHLSTPPYAKFQTLKSSAAGHWLCLAANRFLIRYPYGKNNPPRKITFTEKTPLWISPVWALGTLVSQSADTTGWPTRFTDRQRFQLQDLALNQGGHTPPVAVESAFTRNRLDQFSRAGLSPLAAQPGTDSAFFPKAVTVAETPLSYQLLVNRVTAFVLWCKDNLPAETSPPALETQLRLAFQVFSERSRPPAFDRITISAGHPDAEGKLPVSIELEPATAILPSQSIIQLNIDW